MTRSYGNEVHGDQRGQLPLARLLISRRYLREPTGRRNYTRVLVGGHHRDMAISQPFHHVRRHAIPPDDADDKAGTSMTAWHNQRVTGAGPHHSVLSGASGIAIIACANGPVTLKPGRTGKSIHGARDRSSWLRGPSDPPASDVLGDDADELFLTAARPRLHAEPGDRDEFLVRGNEVRRALNKDAPAFLGGRLYLVYLERDVVFSVRDPGSQVLYHRTVQPGAEHYRLLIEVIVDWQHRRPEPAGVSDPADPAPGDQGQAPRLVQGLDDRFAGRGLTAAVVRLLSCHGDALHCRASLFPAP